MSPVPGRLAVAVSFAIFIVFLLTFQARQVDGLGSMARVISASFLPIYWIAAALAWRAGRTTESGSAVQRAWQLLAIANVLLAINNVIFFAHRQFGAFPEHAGTIFIAIPVVWYGFMFAALARLPRPMRSGLERATFWLDAVTVFVSGLLILLYVFSHTPGQSSAATAASTFTTIAFPALDAALIFAAIVVILRPATGVSRAAVGFLAFAIALMLVSDLAYGRAAAIGMHRPGVWYEPLYLLASVFTVVAANVQIERLDTEGIQQFDIASPTSSLVPYGAALGGVVAVLLELGGHWDTALGRLVVGAVVLMGLIMARQLISRRHIELLSIADEKRVAQQAELERQLTQSQKLEAIGLMAGGIAHDFNNILTAIRGSAELAATEKPASAGDDLRSIVRAVDHGTLLTRQLLAFARRDPIQVQRFDLRDVIREIEPMLRRVVTGNIILSVSLPEHAMPVEMDRGQLEQVLLNLAINARDAMPNGGTLAVEVGTVTLSEPTTVPAAGRYATLDIADTGHGMPPDVVARIFEPFYTTKPRGLGSGLGLSTVYAIITRAGGTIDVSSAVGEGTRFHVLLPVADAFDVTGVSQSSATAVSTPSVPRGREVILLVDDDAAIRSVVARFLSRDGYTVIQESGGDDALNRMASPDLKVDLLLTDLTMPGMSGRVLVERARVLDPKLRVICMSGYSEREEAGNDKPIGFDNFIEKPFSLSTLGRLVRTTLDSPHYHAQPE